MDWQPMRTAPRDGTEILVRRHNGVSYEHYVVCWVESDETYPWLICGGDNALAKGRPDEWMKIPGAADGENACKEGK